MSIFFFATPHLFFLVIFGRISQSSDKPFKTSLNLKMKEVEQ